jgi:NAD(P)-dependent dehydrogenase (short-subunit alcohol dehydrogenase family)
MSATPQRSEGAGRLEGRVAVVTGGGNGIGRACCLRFAEEGADILVADILDDAAAETVGLVKEHGREALTVHVDASSRTDNEAMAQTALERFGKIDVLVTAAGISHSAYVSGKTEIDAQMMSEAASRFGQAGAGITYLEPEQWQKVLDVNLTGTMLAVKACIPNMLERKTGSIITLASIAAKRPEAGPYAYAVSKAGVWMFTKSLARDVAAAGIRVNAIGPGFVETNMTKMFTEIDMVKQMILQEVPMGRVGQPVEIANAALFLASDESSYFTGEILHPDGGFYTE